MILTHLDVFDSVSPSADVPAESFHNTLYFRRSTQTSHLMKGFNSTAPVALHVCESFYRHDIRTEQVGEMKGVMGNVVPYLLQVEKLLAGGVSVEADRFIQNIYKRINWHPNCSLSQFSQRKTRHTESLTHRGR